MKVYGRDTGTQLRLTEKAQKAYDMTEPLTIVQYFFPGKMDDAGGYLESPGIRFNMSGIIERRKLREVEVNQILEDWYDQMQELAEQMEGGSQDGTAADNR